MKDESVRGRNVTTSSFILPPSSFHTDHLLDLGDDLHQIALVSHHLLDVLVSAGNFIQHALVLTTFDTCV